MFLQQIAVRTPAHISATSGINFSRTLVPNQGSKTTLPCRASCEASRSTYYESRRSVSFALFLFHAFISNPKHASASGILDKLDKYIKRKKLEPLEAYVPAVLLSQTQFKDLAKILELDQLKYADCRSLLRSGPVASLRINIRAVAEYASDDGKGKVAFDAVDRCLRALEDLDSLLLRASRNDTGATVESMKAKINIALGAMDGLLQTVPSAVLDKGKMIADAYNTPSSPIPDEGQLENLDPDLKQLESIL